ncbi:MAG: hypothetical protein IPO60_08230 [Flavobacteriales bacterium]|nr:hypothetical protein [Flavobacteriales bacterium]
MTLATITPVFNVEFTYLMRSSRSCRELVHGNPLVYFDNAAMSQKPRRVVEEPRAPAATIDTSVHRGVRTLSHAGHGSAGSRPRRDRPRAST